MSFKRTWPMYTMLIPGITILIIFEYIPLLGVVISFMEYKPWLGFLNSEWVGLSHFRYMFNDPKSIRVILNTLNISVLKLAFGQSVPIVFALLLNEVRRIQIKRTIQTMVYLPHFMSWVILGGVLVDMLSVKNGIVNQMLDLIGIGPIFFLGSNSWFVPTLVVTDIWKEFGFSAIVFLAALAGINPNLYEAAEMDGANRLKQTWHITLPSIIPIIVVMFTMAIGRLMNAGFNQVFNLYSPLVYETGDIIDTYVYRVGLVNGSYSFATAIGLFKAVIGFLLVTITYRLASRFGNYKIF